MLVLASALILIPVVYLLYGSLRSAAPGAPGGQFTLANLARVFTTTELLRPFVNSITIGVATGVVSVAVGAVLAWLVTRTDMARPKVWENLMLIPLYLSPMMFTLAWIALAAPNVGFFNALWRYFGGQGSPVNIYSFSGIVWVLASNYIPYAFVFLLGPMRAIDTTLEEAALVLGSSRWMTQRRIILPLLLPAIFACMVMITTLAAENFAVPALLGRRINLMTLPSEMYFWLSYEPSNPNLAAAAGIPLLMLTLLGISVYRWMVRLSVRYVTVGGKSYNPRKFQLGRWKWLATAVFGLYFGLTVFLPFASLVFGSLLRFLTPRITWSLFTLDNYALIFREQSFLAAIRNSLFLGVAGATLATLLGAVSSYAVQRTRHPARGALDYVTTTSVAMPGIVLGIGMLWAYVRLPWIYATVWVLLIAYVARFLAHSVRVSSSSLLQVSAELDEAAQVFGAGLLRRWKDIIFPLIRNGLFSSWILIFIFVINEISTTIVLYSPRSTTLSVLIWQALDMYGATRAFAYAVIQAVLVLVAVALLYLAYGRNAGSAASAAE